MRKGDVEAARGRLGSMENGRRDQDLRGQEGAGLSRGRGSTWPLGNTGKKSRRSIWVCHPSYLKVLPEVAAGPCLSSACSSELPPVPMRGKSALSSGWANFLGSHSFPQQSRRREILGTEVDLALFSQLSSGLVSSMPTLSPALLFLGLWMRLNSLTQWTGRASRWGRTLQDVGGHCRLCDEWLASSGGALKRGCGGATSF